MSKKTKRWNVGLQVSPEEEQKIKISAIQNGMGVADYVKKVLLDNLSAKISDQEIVKKQCSKSRKTVF